MYYLFTFACCILYVFAFRIVRAPIELLSCVCASGGSSQNKTSAAVWAFGALNIFNVLCFDTFINLRKRIQSIINCSDVVFIQKVKGSLIADIEYNRGDIATIDNIYIIAGNLNAFQCASVRKNYNGVSGSLLSQKQPQMLDMRAILHNRVVKMLLMTSTSARR